MEILSLLCVTFGQLSFHLHRAADGPNSIVIVRLLACSLADSIQFDPIQRAIVIPSSEATPCSSLIGHLIMIISPSPRAFRARRSPNDSTLDRRRRWPVTHSFRDKSVSITSAEANQNKRTKGKQIVLHKTQRNTDDDKRSMSEPPIADPSQGH